MRSAHCLHIALVIWKCLYIFGGDLAGGGTWKNLSMEEFSMEGEPDFQESFKRRPGMK